MRRRLISAAALVACAVCALAAAERATFILTDGERQSGTVASRGDQHENLVNGYLSLASGGKERTFLIDQVGVIDFVGGTPSTTEVAQLGAGPLLVMRDTSTQPGQFVNMIDGETLIWDNANGQRQEFFIRDVARVYLDPRLARTLFNAPSPGAAVATAPMAGAIVHVDAKQAWTDTGITVTAGDRVVFNASGRLVFGRGTGQTSDPNGNPAETRANYPDPTVPVGALLGRVGNGVPFAIGLQTQPLVMPASGRLLLGVNDNELNDNSGFYSVTVTRQ
jgi:hypothetical protein